MNKGEIKDAYVYRHLKRETSEVFYIGIGKTKNFSRAYTHHNRNNHWKNITNKYIFDVDILSVNLSWEEACELECILIDYYGRVDLGTGSLVNHTKGGDGIVGRVIKQKSIDNQRRKMLGKNHHFYGKQLTKEHKNNISKGLKGKFKGENNPFYGKKHSKESLLKISKVHKGKKITEKQREQMSINRQGVKHPGAKKVDQFTLEGSFIKTWNCIKEAESYYNNNPRAKNIVACCNNRQNTAYKFKWKHNK